MRLRRLIKTFHWRAEDVDDVTLGEKTRINPKTHRAQLASDAGAYPLDEDLVVKSRLTQPRSLRAWIGFEARSFHFVNDEGEQLTSIGFRLDDGTSEFWWDGAAWSAPADGDWNTEQEVADNIASFDARASDCKMRVVANLRTTDPRCTPQLEWVKMLYTAHIEFQEDLVYRSLIPDLKAKIRPVSRTVVEMPETGSTLNISALGLETGFNVRNVDAVFDYDADEEGARDGSAADLLASFNPTTGLMTFAAPVESGTRLWIRFIYEPEVAVTTHPDYIEQERLPAIVLAEISLVGMVEAPAADDHVANKGAGTAVWVPSPQQGDLQISLLGMTENAVDHQRLMEEVNTYFQNTPHLLSTGLDERYRLHLINEYASEGEPGEESIHVGRALFQIKNFRRWLRNAVDDHIVQRVDLATGIVSGDVPDVPVDHLDLSIRVR